MCEGRAVERDVRRIHDGASPAADRFGRPSDIVGDAYELSRREPVRVRRADLDLPGAVVDDARDGPADNGGEHRARRRAIVDTHPSDRDISDRIVKRRVEIDVDGHPNRIAESFVLKHRPTPRIAARVLLQSTNASNVHAGEEWPERLRVTVGSLRKKDGVALHRVCLHRIEGGIAKIGTRWVGAEIDRIENFRSARSNRNGAVGVAITNPVWRAHARCIGRAHRHPSHRKADRTCHAGAEIFDRPIERPGSVYRHGFARRCVIFRNAR